MRQFTPERMRELVLSFGVWAPAAYFVAYAQPFIPLPSSIAMMAGGLAFGPIWGTFAVLVSALARACSQFFLARFLGREAISQLLRGRAVKLDQKIGKHAFKAVLLIRLVSGMPFDLQNYGLGCSRVHFRPYFFGSLLGLIPWTIGFVCLGYSVFSIADPSNIWKLFLVLILIMVLINSRRWLVSHKREISK